MLPPDRFSRLRVDVPLAVYVDLKSPYAFISLEPTRAMAAARGVPIDWRPFTLDIPSYLGSARLDARGKVASSDRTPQQWSGVRYAYRDARRYATLRGKTLRGTEKIWNSSLAGIAMLWAKAQGPAALDRFLDEANARFWRRELDIEDPSVLAVLLQELGLEVDGFQSFLEGSGRTLHDEMNQAAFDAGVFGVPTYLVEDEMWFGREHLPRVSWLIGGRVGAPPDVANRSFDPPSSPAAPQGGALTGAGSPARGGEPLLAVLDLRHPLAALALRPVRAFAREQALALDWLPLTTPTLRAPGPSAPSDDRGARHRRFRAQAIEREIEVYARGQGRELREPHRDGSAEAAHLGWLWVRERARDRLEDFLEDLFEAYWSLRIDAADPAQVAARVDAVGADGAAFLDWSKSEGPAAARDVEAGLRGRGVSQVPSFVLGDEIFQGRQHLPMIAWRLDGRSGPIPI